MFKAKNDQQRSRNSKKLSGLVFKTLAIAIGSVSIFAIGLGIGQGKIQVGGDSVTQRSVQDGDLPADLDYSSVEDVYDALKKNYDGDLEEQALLDGIKQGLANASGDNYTEYLNATATEEFNEDLNGTFSGIGAELGKEEQALVIIAPIAGFPAEKAGLRAQDIITEINGENAFDLSVTEAVKKIRGEKGTKVTLGIVRDGQQRLEVEVTRDTISIPSVESEILEGGIGYLKVSRFSDDTAQLTRTAAQEFKNAGVKGVILDVRNDPGGLLDASVDVASLWLDNKVVLQEKRNDVVIRTYQSRGSALLAGLPTVVLINEGSASASEIVAGALKDHGAASLIGNQTFGKGSVQQLVNLPGDGVLKVTIARWYTPDGKNIDKEGITPDKKVDRTDEDFKADRDPQKQAAIDFLKK